MRKTKTNKKIYDTLRSNHLSNGGDPEDIPAEYPFVDQDGGSGLENVLFQPIVHVVDDAFYPENLRVLFLGGLFSNYDDARDALKKFVSAAVHDTRVTDQLKGADVFIRFYRYQQDKGDFREDRYSVLCDGRILV